MISVTYPPGKTHAKAAFCMPLKEMAPHWLHGAAELNSLNAIVAAGCYDSGRFGLAFSSSPCDDQSCGGAFVI